MAVLTATLAGCGLRSSSVADIVVDDIGPGWFELIDMQLTEENAQAFAVLAGDPDPETGDLPEAWMRVWFRGEEDGAAVVLIDAEEKIEGHLSEAIPYLSSDPDISVLGPHPSFHEAYSIEIEGEPGIVAARGGHLAVIFFSGGVSPQEQTEIVGSQLDAIPAYDPDAGARPFLIVLSGIAFLITLAFAIRSARRPITTWTDSGESSAT